MQFPQRHRTHEIEELSRRYFISSIPSNWITHQITEDYGLDYNCEITIGRNVTGSNFSVQLKGKEKAPDRTKVVVTGIKRSTINFWLNRLEPVMVIVYVVSEKEAYWHLVDYNTFDLTLSNKTYSLTIPKKSKLSQIQWPKIVAYVNEIFSRRHHLYDLPKIEDKSKSAWELFFQKNYEEALLLFKKLSAKDNKDSSIWNAIAVCEYELLHYQEAIVAINRALGIEENEMLLINKAAILTEQGAVQNDIAKIQTAVEIYSKVVSEGGSFDSLFYDYGSALLKLGEYNNAISQLHTAIDLNPNNPNVWNNLGNAHLNLNQYDNAIDCFNKALTINANLPETLFSKGSTLYKKGLVDDGLELMLKSAQLSQRYELDFPYMFFWIAEAFLEKKDYRKAYDWNQKGLIIFPSDKYLADQQSRISHCNHLETELKELIEKASDAELKAYSSVPIIFTDELENYYLKGSPAWNFIYYYLEEKKKKDLVINNEYNSSCKRIYYIKILKIREEEIIIESKEYWKLHWYNVNEKRYVDDELYNIVNTQLYTLVKNGSQWRIFDVFVPHNNDEKHAIP